MFSATLERLILSIELPEEKLAEYCRTLPVPCELLGAGAVLLFYSPRSLLADHLAANQDADDDESSAVRYLQASVSSEEARHRQFPTLETVHGTFMFLDKDQFILDRLEALENAGLHSVRLDLRHLSETDDNENHNAAGIDAIRRQALQDPAALRKNWPRETRAPFFKTNKTTASFSKMKSKVAGFRNEDCLAEMVAGENGRYIVFHSLRSFAAAAARTIILPSGERIDLQQDMVLRDLNGDLIETAQTDQLVICDWIKKAVPGALLMTGH
jgi:putative protease